MNLIPPSPPLSTRESKQQALQKALTQVAKWLECAMDRAQTQLREKGLDPLRPFESLQESQRLSPEQQTQLAELARQQTTHLAATPTQSSPSPSAPQTQRANGRVRDPLSTHARHLRV